MVVKGRAHLGRCKGILPAICHGLQHMLAREAQRAQAVENGAVETCTLRKLLVYVQGVEVAAEPVQGCCTARKLISAPRPCCPATNQACRVWQLEVELEAEYNIFSDMGCLPARDALLRHSIWLAIWRLVGRYSTRTPPAHWHALVCPTSEGL